MDTKQRYFTQSFFFIVLSTFGVFAFAQDNDPAQVVDNDHLSFNLDKIELQKVQLVDDNKSPFDFTPQNLKRININNFRFNQFAGGIDDAAQAESPLKIAEGMFVLGEKIWKFVEANQPVVSINGAYAHIVPQEAQSWQELENWSRPVSALYKATYKNLYGITVVDLAFRVTFTPRGTYNGKGKYIANLTVLPELVEVGWGYTVEAGAKIYEVLNRGTEEDPLATAQIAVGWKIKTILKSSTTNKSLFVEGDGSVTNLSAAQ
ncbi:MAG: hypothetical protein R3A80_06940 [Bdellovibrionota bacterium]